MNRRSFLSTMLAACAAPAIVRAESIMRIKPVLLPWIDYTPGEGWIPCDGREIRAPALRKALFPVGTVLYFAKPGLDGRPLLEVEPRVWDGAQWLPFSDVNIRLVAG